MPPSPASVWRSCRSLGRPALGRAAGPGGWPARDVRRSPYWSLDRPPCLGSAAAIHRVPGQGTGAMAAVLEDDLERRMRDLGRAGRAAAQALATAPRAAKDAALRVAAGALQAEHTV